MRAPRWLIGQAMLVVIGAYPSAVRARSAGIAALGCDGCHSGGAATRVSLTAMPSTVAVGQPVTLTITVPQTNGPSAGFYLTTAFEAQGYFGPAEAGTVVSTSGVSHTAPRVGSGGSTVFKAQWTAREATGVTFDVYALSANGDRTNRGDGWGTARLELAVGCVGQRYYIDQDGDGYGSDDPAYASRLECAAIAGYAARGGDCDDFHADVHPDAPELCDLRDNDCDGAADDDVVSQLYCEDRDGDGHGAMGRATKTDCKPTPGFGDCDGDCDDGDPLFYPGAPEICDRRDNDCDGEADEDVRPICGLGLCARRARDCSSASCTPGDPVAETCNGYDDDCDGIIDNGCTGSTETAGGSNSEAGGSAGGRGPSVAGAGGQAEPSSSAPASCGVASPRSRGEGWWGVGVSIALAVFRRRRAGLASRFTQGE